MKGQGGSFGFPLMTRIADSLGRFIENLPLCGHREMDVINVHLNAMRMVLAEHLTDGGGQAGERMLLGLDHVIEKYQPSLTAFRHPSLGPAPSPFLRDLS